MNKTDLMAEGAKRYGTMENSIDPDHEKQINRAINTVLSSMAQEYGGQRIAKADVLDYVVSNVHFVLTDEEMSYAKKAVRESI